jgi:hypothetical protein
MKHTEQKALALVNEVRAERGQEIWKQVGDRKGYGTVLETVCRAIEQHESFKQEVSDVVAQYKADQPYIWHQSAFDYLERFIIPKPDPLVEVLDDLGWFSGEEEVGNLRAALEARGLEIREKD